MFFFFSQQKTSKTSIFSQPLFPLCFFSDSFEGFCYCVLCFVFVFVCAFVCVFWQEKHITNLMLTDPKWLPYLYKFYYNIKLQTIILRKKNLNYLISFMSTTLLLQHVWNKENLNVWCVYILVTRGHFFFIINYVILLCYNNNVWKRDF